MNFLGGGSELIGLKGNRWDSGGSFTLADDGRCGGGGGGVAGTVEDRPPPPLPPVGMRDGGGGGGGWRPGGPGWPPLLLTGRLRAGTAGGVSCCMDSRLGCPCCGGGAGGACWRCCGYLALAGGGVGGVRGGGGRAADAGGEATLKTGFLPAGGGGGAAPRSAGRIGACCLCGWGCGGGWGWGGGGGGIFMDGGRLPLPPFCAGPPLVVARSANLLASSCWKLPSGTPTPAPPEELAEPALDVSADVESRWPEPADPVPLLLLLPPTRAWLRSRF